MILGDYQVATLMWALFWFVNAKPVLKSLLSIINPLMPLTITQWIPQKKPISNAYTLDTGSKNRTQWRTRLIS